MLKGNNERMKLVIVAHAWNSIYSETKKKKLKVQSLPEVHNKVKAWCGKSFCL